MAESLCSLRKKGGKMSETYLWVNSSPASSTGFASGDVSLSKNLSDYKYVKINYGYAYNDYGLSSRFSVIYDVEQFKETVSPATFGFTGCLNVTHKSDGYFYDRRVLYKNDSTVTFGSCMKYKNNTTASLANIYVIPLHVVGLK